MKRNIKKPNPISSRFFQPIVFILILVGFCSCSVVEYFWDWEIDYRRYQNRALCKNELVYEFRAVVTNENAIPGKEILRCSKEGKRIPYDLSASEEMDLKEDAEDLFYSFCQTNRTTTAKLTVKGRKIGTIIRTCTR